MSDQQHQLMNRAGKVSGSTGGSGEQPSGPVAADCIRDELMSLIAARFKDKCPQSEEMP